MQGGALLSCVIRGGDFSYRRNVLTALVLASPPDLPRQFTADTCSRPQTGSDQSCVHHGYVTATHCRCLGKERTAGATANELGLPTEPCHVELRGLGPLTT